MSIRTIKIPVTLAGSNGSASGNAQTVYPLSGRIASVYIDVTTGSQPNAVDITVSTPGNDNRPAQTILTATNVSSSGWHYPTVALEDNVAAAATYDGTHAVRGKPPVNDYIKVAGAQGNAGALIVYVDVECD